jgi:hypothetical protein
MLKHYSEVRVILAWIIWREYLLGISIEVTKISEGISYRNNGNICCDMFCIQHSPFYPVARVIIIQVILLNLATVKL